MVVSKELSQPVRCKQRFIDYGICPSRFMYELLIHSIANLNRLHTIKDLST